MQKTDNLLQHNLQNKKLRETILTSIGDVFPIVSGDKTMTVENLRTEDNLDDWDFPKQRKFKMQRKSWQNPIYGDVVITDTETGKVLSKKAKTKLGNIPAITNRFTTIIDGNEYQTINQLRRKSGIYSRVKKNGELESEFNLEKGYNFKMMLDPETQLFVLIMDNRKYRLWTLLNLLGVLDSEIAKEWGHRLLEVNKKGALNTEVSEITSIYKKVYNKEPADFDAAQEGLRKYFTEYTKVDPDTTKMTLGESFESVTGAALLSTSKKLLAINKGNDVPDERDSLIFKRLYAIDDLLVSHLDKQKIGIERKLARTMQLKNNVGDILGSSTFGKPIKTFFTSGDLSATPPQTNPVTIVEAWRRTTPMGTGGIQSRHSITMETRDVQPSHLGFLDPTSTPESGKVGVTVGLGSEVIKLDNDMATPVVSKTGEKSYIKPIEFFEAIVGYPDQYDLVDGKPKAKKDKVSAMKKGKLVKVDASKIDYYIRSPKSMFSFSTNLVPFLQNTQGNRASTGARMITQAMSLVDREEPLVQTRRSDKGTYEKFIGSYLNPVLGIGDDGKKIKEAVVTKVTSDYVYMKTPDGKEIKRGLYRNFPLNQDGFLNSIPLVKEGDKVTTDTQLADNNYTKDSTLSLGKNLTVAYMPWKGYNYEDGAVITESAAKKLSHQTMHKVNIFFSPKISVMDKSRFIAWYPNDISPSNLNKLDEKGLPKVGQKFLPGEILAAYLVEKEMDDTDRALKKLDKHTFSQYNKKISEWDEDEPGIVTDVQVVGRNIDIYIKSVHPFKEGDKVSARYGNKSIVTKIIPDSEAPHRKDGTPVEIILNPHGVPSRMNLGQILETAASKIAKKTGKTFITDNFEDPDKDMSKEILDKMQKLGLEPDEVLRNGKNGEEFPEKIFTGDQYFIKLRHIIKKKQGVHSYGSYDIDDLPVGKGAQKVGVLDTYSYLAHGAKANLNEITNVKGRENEEYWRNLQLGLPPVPTNKNFVFDKLLGYLKGAGVNVKKEGNRLRIMPLTDKETLDMSNGEITDPAALLVGKNLGARKNGLFDVTVTGGTRGTHWSHIKLTNRIPNPMYADAIMKVLNLTEKSYMDTLAGNYSIDGVTGSEAILSALKKLNVKKDTKELKEELRTAPPTNVNKLNRRIRYLETLTELGLKPEEAYTMKNLPVLPPVFRPIYPLQTGDLMVSDINKHYRDVGAINISLKKAKKSLTEKEQIEATNALYNSVRALQGFTDPVNYSGEKYKGILQEISGKRALIQNAAWAKRQDISARSTITVEPSLGINQVGIPKDMAYKMMKPFVIKDLKESGLKASNALREYKDESPMAMNSLANVMKSRPVILNRAPSLHKHSIQAFNPVLVSGKSIRLNPVVFNGFNADLDGDTMSIMAPIGYAAVEEAKQMMPDKILFKHGDNALMPQISQEYLYGLHKLSLIDKKTDKRFSTIEAARKAKMPWTHQFMLGDKPMTIGQYMINAKLPKELRDYKRMLDGKVVKDLLTEIGMKYQNYFSEVINSWKDLGSTYASMSGNTFSLRDLAIDRSYKYDLLKSKLPEINKLKGKAKIDALNELTKEVQRAQDKAQSGTNNMYKMLKAKSFTKADSIRQVLSMPGVLKDVHGDSIDIPVTKSYAEGLDTPGYFTTLYGVRSGTVDRSVNTQDTGALNKSLLTVTRRLIITENDCGTRKGIEFPVNDKNVMDRFALETIPGVIKRNDLIDTQALLKLKKVKVDVIEVRSPLTCTAPNGVCQLCYGLLPNGEMAPVGTNVGILEGQALTERSTQLQMQTFHTGGTTLGGGGGITAGFPRLTQILKVPEKLSGKATLSTVKGIVKKINKNLTGGFTLRIEGYGTKNDKDFVIPAGRKPIVSIGDKVSPGDPLSDGVIKPQELSALKSHLDAQNYLVDEASAIFQNKFYRKTFETVIRGLSDNAQITSAPRGSKFLRGDKTTISYIDDINKDRKKEGLELIKYNPYFKSIETLNTDSEDWFTRITSNRLKMALTTGAARGQYANLKGKDPIPAYLYGDNFGKAIDEDEGAFY
jgi:DNA-directed RNA polymerase subunit beta'